MILSDQITTTTTTTAKERKKILLPSPKVLPGETIQLEPIVPHPLYLLALCTDHFLSSEQELEKVHF